MPAKQKVKSKIGIKMILLIQSMVFLYSLVSMLSKYASSFLQKYGLFSVQFILLFGIMVGCLGIYAILWQKVLKKVDLITAYVHKSTTLIWSLLWAVTLFGESLAWNNIVGVLIVVVGVMLVTQDD